MFYPKASLDPLWCVSGGRRSLSWSRLGNYRDVSKTGLFTDRLKRQPVAKYSRHDVPEKWFPVTPASSPLLYIITARMQRDILAVNYCKFTFFFFPTLSSVVRLDSESSTGRFIDLLLAIVIDRFSATSLHRNLCKMLDANEVRTACSLFGMARCI